MIENSDNFSINTISIEKVILEKPYCCAYAKIILDDIIWMTFDIIYPERNDLDLYRKLHLALERDTGIKIKSVAKQLFDKDKYAIVICFHNPEDALLFKLTYV